MSDAEHCAWSVWTAVRDSGVDLGGVSKGQPGLPVVEQHSDALLTVVTVTAQEQWSRWGGCGQPSPGFAVSPEDFWADSRARHGIWENQGGLERSWATEFIGLHGGNIAVVWTSIVLDMSNYYYRFIFIFWDKVSSCSSGLELPGLTSDPGRPLIQLQVLRLQLWTSVCTFSRCGNEAASSRRVDICCGIEEPILPFGTSRGQ